MKICLIGNDYVQQLPLIGYGGIETCVESLAWGLYKAGLDFFVIIPKRKEKKDYPFKIIETEIEPTSITKESANKFGWSCRKIIQQEKPNIIWSQSEWSVNALWDLDIKIICTLHDACEKQAGWIKNYSNVNYRFLSEFSYNNWVKEEWEKNKSFICHSGVMEEDYTFYGREKREDYFLWVGGLQWGWKAKGLDFFISLAYEFKDKKFVAYGTGNEQIEKELNHLQEGLPNFFYRGQLTRGIKHTEAFGKAKAFIMPTRTLDTFPRTVLESLSKGTPVIAFANGALPEMIGIDGGGLVNSKEDIQFFIEKEWDYDKIYKYSKKFSVESEIKILLKNDKL